MMRQSEYPSAFFTLMAGGFAGTFSWLISFPIDVIKSRLQVDGMDGKQKYNGALDCFRKSYQSEGISFLSRGLISTLMRAFPMNAVCFLIVSYVMKFFEKSKKIDVTIAKTEPLIIDTYPQTFIMRVFQKTYHHQPTKYLILLDGFHEASCHEDMIELSDSLREKRYSTTYFYKMNNELLFKKLSEDEMKTPLTLSD